MPAGRRNSFYVRGKGRKYLRKRNLPPEADGQSLRFFEMTRPDFIRRYDRYIEQFRTEVVFVFK